MPSGAERYFERRRAMDRVEFEAALREEGYLEVADRRMEPNKTNPEHSHEFEARLLVLEGEITITCEGEERTYSAGDTFAMSAARPHTGQGGAEDVRDLSGRHYQQKAAI